VRNSTGGYDEYARGNPEAIWRQRSIRPTKEADVLWRVGINGHGDPLTAIDVGQALKLSEELRAAGEDELAAHIVTAMNEARKSQVQGL
jgi:hypothetical protein